MYPTAFSTYVSLLIKYELCVCPPCILYKGAVHWIIDNSPPTNVSWNPGDIESDKESMCIVYSVYRYIESLDYGMAIFSYKPHHLIFLSSPPSPSLCLLSLPFWSLLRVSIAAGAVFLFRLKDVIPLMTFPSTPFFLHLFSPLPLLCVPFHKLSTSPHLLSLFPTLDPCLWHSPRSHFTHIHTIVCW